MRGGVGPDVSEAVSDLVSWYCYRLRAAPALASRLLGARANATTDLYPFLVPPGWARACDDGAPRAPASAIQLWFPFLRDAPFKKIVSLGRFPDEDERNFSFGRSTTRRAKSACGEGLIEILAED